MWPQTVDIFETAWGIGLFLNLEVIKKITEMKAEPRFNSKHLTVKIYNYPFQWFRQLLINLTCYSWNHDLVGVFVVSLERLNDHDDPELVWKHWLQTHEWPNKTLLCPQPVGKYQTVIDLHNIIIHLPLCQFPKSPTKTIAERTPSPTFSNFCDLI